jgi:hypothetical protein
VELTDHLGLVGKMWTFTPTRNWIPVVFVVFSHFTAWTLQASVHLQQFRPCTIPSLTWFAQGCIVMYSTFCSSRTNGGTLTYVIVAFPRVVTWLEILSHFSWNFGKWQLACHFCQSVRQSIYLSVRPSVRPDGFSWNFIFKYFSKFCPEIQFWLKSEKINGHLTCRPTHIYDNISLNYS